MKGQWEHEGKRVTAALLHRGSWAPTTGHGVGGGLSPAPGPPASPVRRSRGKAGEEMTETVSAHAWDGPTAGLPGTGMSIFPKENVLWLFMP